jgi:hypothetical protein
VKSLDAKLEWGLDDGGRYVVTARSGDYSWSCYGATMKVAAMQLAEVLASGSGIEDAERAAVAYRAYRQAVRQRSHAGIVDENEVAAEFRAWWADQ